MDKTNFGRNERCHCGSGLKYKRCCLDEDREEKYKRTLEKSRELFRRAWVEELEEDFGMMAFHEFFPDVAEKENRVFWSNERDPQTREPYQIIEYYCADPKCDCNRVIIAVADREEMKEGTILSVGFAFDRKDPDPGPYIDPLNPLTLEGQSLYPLIEDMLQTDFAYIQSLKRHYEMVKRKIKYETKAGRDAQPTMSP